jgi:hypothetical protein
MDMFKVSHLFNKRWQAFVYCPFVLPLLTACVHTALLEDPTIDESLLFKCSNLTQGFIRCNNAELICYKVFARDKETKETKVVDVWCSSKKLLGQCSI